VFWKRGCWWIICRCFETIHSRHAHVHEHKGDIGFQQMFEGVHSRMSLDQILAEFTEHTGNPVRRIGHRYFRGSGRAAFYWAGHYVGDANTMIGSTRETVQAPATKIG
jgi:hypothetical protein